MILSNCKPKSWVSRSRVLEQFTGHVTRDRFQLSVFHGDDECHAVFHRRFKGNKSPFLRINSPHSTDTYRHYQPIANCGCEHATRNFLSSTNIQPRFQDQWDLFQQITLKNSRSLLFNEGSQVCNTNSQRSCSKMENLCSQKLENLTKSRRQLSTRSHSVTVRLSHRNVENQDIEKFDLSTIVVASCPLLLVRLRSHTTLHLALVSCNEGSDICRHFGSAYDDNDTIQSIDDST